MRVSSGRGGANRGAQRTQRACWARRFVAFGALGLATTGCFALFALDGYGPVQVPNEAAPADVVDPDVLVDAGPDVARLEGKIVFVTGADFSVGLGNQVSTTAAANTMCEQTATRAGLQGTFVAWISDDGTPPPLAALADAAADKIQLITTTRQVLARNFAELFDGGPRLAINATEDAATLPEAPALDKDGNCPNSGLVWTGFSVKAGEDPPHCSQWQSGASGQNGGVGRMAKHPTEWSYACNLACSMKARLYCFQL